MGTDSSVSRLDLHESMVRADWHLMCSVDCLYILLLYSLLYEPDCTEPFLLPVMYEYAEQFDHYIGST